MFLNISPHVDVFRHNCFYLNFYNYSIFVDFIVLWRCLLKRGVNMTRRYALRDDQWERIKELLPGKEGDVGVTAKDNR